MRILSINWVVADPTFAQRYRTHYLAEEWVRQGHRVTILSGTFSHLHQQEVSGAGSLIETECNGVQYLHLRAPAYQGSGIGRAKNILGYALQSRIMEGRIHSKGPYDLVISGTVYQIDNFLARTLALKSDCPWIRETRDLWPMTLYEIAGMSNKHPFARLVQMGEDLACKHADLIVSTLPNAFDHLKTRGLSESRFRWSPQGANPVSTDPAPLPIEHADLFDSLRERGKIIGVMAGGLVPAINLPLLLEATSLVASAGVDVVVVGSGELEEQVRKATGKNIHLLPRIQQGAMPSLLERADFGISGFKNLNLYRYGVSPNKVTEYLANGLPVVLYVPHAKNLVDEAKAGIVTDADSPEQVAAGMIKMATMSPTERQAMGNLGKTYIESHAAISTIAKQYLSWIE